jgi:hypothetical protein
MDKQEEYRLTNSFQVLKELLGDESIVEQWRKVKRQ